VVFFSGEGIALFWPAAVTGATLRQAAATRNDSMPRKEYCIVASKKYGLILFTQTGDLDQGR